METVEQLVSFHHIQVQLSGGAPWGFTLKGGLEHGEPLIITKATVPPCLLRCFRTTMAADGTRNVEVSQKNVLTFGGRHAASCLGLTLMDQSPGPPLPPGRRPFNPALLSGLITGSNGFHTTPETHSLWLSTLLFCHSAIDFEPTVPVTRGPSSPSRPKRRALIQEELFLDCFTCFTAPRRPNVGVTHACGHQRHGYQWKWKIEDGGKAAHCKKLKVGDELININGSALYGSRQEALILIKGSYRILKLTLQTAVWQGGAASCSGPPKRGQASSSRKLREGFSCSRSGVAPTDPRRDGHPDRRVSREGARSRSESGPR
ncbi:unnamed protein product [Menidia menidia]|uniref:(Atlantic silverside) hypothetical protein n=1 Tax=Menidia menidia TaxID=238744 RepID=A0A8S4B5L9_9TELE|nr:unnamed protein product [Menidia menidia]